MALQIPTASYQNLTSSTNISPNKFVCLQFPSSEQNKQQQQTTMSDDTELENSGDIDFSADSSSSPHHQYTQNSLKTSTSLNRFNTFRLDNKLFDETRELELTTNDTDEKPLTILLNDSKKKKYFSKKKCVDSSNLVSCSSLSSSETSTTSSKESTTKTTTTTTQQINHANDDFDLVAKTNLIDSPMSKSKIKVKPKTSRTATVVISLRKSMRRASKKSRKNNDDDNENENKIEIISKATNSNNSNNLLQIKPSSLSLLSHPSQSFIDEFELNENKKKLHDSTENTVGSIESNFINNTINMSSKTRQLMHLTTQLKRANMFFENNLNTSQQQQQEMNVSSDGTNEIVVNRRERRDSGVGGSLTREIELVLFKYFFINKIGQKKSRNMGL